MTTRSRAPVRTRVTRAAEDAPPAAARAEESTAGFWATAVGHGGRLSAAMAAHPAAPTPWLDLSTGINPDPWRGARASFEALSRLPDPQQLADLEAAAARAFGVADPRRVVATAGAEAGLRLLPRLIPAGEVDVVSPTYASHEATWRAGGGQVRRITLDQAAAAAGDLLVLVNPNNPDGGAVQRDRLTEIVRARSARRRWTVVDESFVETAPELSVSDLEDDRLVVLRSFGKFYGLPGVRLGFVIAPPDLAAQLRALQGDWPVSADALVLGTAAYGDAAWRLRTRTALEAAAADLDALLAANGLEVRGGTSLFRLVTTPDARAVFEGLCRAGVLTRPFAQCADWLRFGLPRREDFARLDAALRQVTR